MSVQDEIKCLGCTKVYRKQDSMCANCIKLVAMLNATWRIYNAEDNASPPRGARMANGAQRMRDSKQF